MHIEFDYFNDESRLKIAKALGIAPLRLEATLDNADKLILGARVHCLSKDELYFLQSPDELLRPLNHRNEAAAVSLLLQRLGDAEAGPLRARLSQHCESLWPLFRQDSDPAERPATFPDANSPAAAFHAWAEDNGIKSSIKIAAFGDLRGCAATQDIAPGDNILSIPREALIYEDTVKETDLGRMLSALPGLSADNLLIIFTLCDRFDPDSRWAPFWRSLPDAYFTGLSFPPRVVSALRGTAAHLEIIRGQTHLRKQYADTRPLLDILLKAYPQYLDADWFTYERYVWAAELFYSYAFEIEFPGCPKSKTVMVPFACHVNHSPWPHVVRYGRLDPQTGALHYPAFRPASKGEQVFISYGPVPNMKLISYYGFAVAGNPNDLVPLELAPPDGGLSPAQAKALATCGLGMEHSLRDGPLPAQLLGCLRVVVATPEEAAAVVSGKQDPLQGPLSAEGEVQALDTLEAALQGMLEPVEESLRKLEEGEKSNGGEGDGAGGAAALNENGFDSEWRASLGFCRVYMEGQRDIIRRAIAECHKLKE